MTAKECIKGRRSIRKFKDQKVPEELLSEIVETASYSPSWKHSQITRYVAVDGEKKEKLLTVVQKCSLTMVSSSKMLPC